MEECAPRERRQDIVRYRKLIRKGGNRTPGETFELNEISLDLFGKVANTEQIKKVSIKLPNGYEEI